MQASPSSSNDLDALLKQELALWTKVVKEGNIKAE
jgi:hypothetical protein